MFPLSVQGVNLNEVITCPVLGLRINNLNEVKTNDKRRKECNHR